MVKLTDFFKKKDTCRPEDVEELRQRYGAFRSLLEENREILEIITDLEEKRNGEYLFDMQYLRSNVRRLSEKVYSLIRNLNEISGEGYKTLYPVYSRIQQELQEFLSRRKKIPPDSPVLPLAEITREKEDSVGGKMANLGELRNRVKVAVPEGFAITAQAYKDFIDAHRLQETISQRLARLDIDNLEDLILVSREIQQMILEKELPPALTEAIDREIQSLVARQGPDMALAVRSSALGEDSKISFAGQYGTVLNVPPDQVGRRYREIMASKFTPRAIFYFLGKGFREEDLAMGTGCIAMICARAAGVVYTVDPLNPDRNELVIHAHWGLGQAVVDGTVTPDVFLVSKKEPFQVKEAAVAHKERLLACTRQGDLAEVSVPWEDQDSPSLSESLILELAGTAKRIEEHYKQPQDIEWAVDGQGKLFILQTRPLKVFEAKPAREKEREKIDPVRHPILLDTGVLGAPGVGSGPVYVVHRDEDLAGFPTGAVLVARVPSPKYVTVMNRARGIITDLGSAASHMAALARDFHVPTVLNTQRATQVLTPGLEVTVDAGNRIIYQGTIENLLGDQGERHNLFEETSLFLLFEKILDKIVPLNLIDPLDPGFTPKNCQTYHDLTRFVHQTATQEMFNLSSKSRVSEAKAIKLDTKIPIEIFLVDLGEAILPEYRKGKVKKEHIHSWPFQALWKGIESMKWPAPKPMDLKGFASVVAQTATDGSEVIYSDKSFALLSEEYMNFNIRLGYHLSTIEVFGGLNENENFIKFIFKGGGATIERRDRRTRVITKVLEKLGFQVTRKLDFLDAVLPGYPRELMEKILLVMGKLTLYTKQLDMVMFNDAIVEWSTEEFFKEHIGRELMEELAGSPGY